MIWAKCRDWLLPALKAEDGDEVMLLGDILAGRAQLWTGARSAMVTQVLPEPPGKCIHGWLAGGELAEILTLIPGVEAWARTHGCSHVTINGRPGWDRALAPQGYRRNGDELVKVL